MEEYIDKVMEHKHALIFVGGIAAAIAGKKILESKAVKEGCTKGMAAVLAAKKDAEECTRTWFKMRRTLLLMLIKMIKKQFMLKMTNKV